MSADDSTEKKPEPTPADRTLLGVAPPKLETTPDLGLQRSPVFVRSGTSEAEGTEPPPLPRMALPSRLPSPTPGEAVEPAAGDSTHVPTSTGLASLMRRRPLLWMVVLPAALGALAVVVAMLTAPPRKAKQALEPATAKAVAAATPPSATPEKPADGDGSAALALLESRAPESLTAEELVALAEGRAARERLAAKALRERLGVDGALAHDKATQAKLLGWAQQSETWREALLALSSIDGSLGPDLLYEVWTGTSARNDATELARALVYSKEVRSRASKALSIALDLRSADTCEKTRELLPRAVTDGDKRSHHLLAKLQSKRGCGPKKLGDCFACLREKKDELNAALNAVKARRAPAYPVP